MADPVKAAQVVEMALKRARQAAKSARIAEYKDPVTTKAEDWKWKPLEGVADELKIEAVPDYIQGGFGDFMKEQLKRAERGDLNARDLIKAYTITQASIGRQGRSHATATKQGLRLPNTGEEIRPEGAFAEWLGSPMGQRYLNAAELGKPDHAAMQQLRTMFSPYGKQDDQVAKMQWAVDNLPNMAKDLNARVAGGRDDWRDYSDSLRGIAAAKSGFVGSLLGRGDIPTLDARQINLHTTPAPVDMGSIQKRGKGTGGRELVDRLAARQEALALGLDPSLAPFYQHLGHHAVWDKIGGTETTHNDLMKAMRGYDKGGVVHMEDGGDVNQAELDRMRLELANSPVIEATPQSMPQKMIGTVGGYMDQAGKFISESLKPIAETHPIRTFLTDMLIADPLKSAGTALQDYTKTGREITEEQPYTRSPVTGSGQTLRLDPRVLDVAQFASPVIKGATKLAGAGAKAAAPFASKVDDMVRELYEAGTIPQPGLSIKDTTPKVLAPANEQGFYSPTEAAALNLQRKSGNGQAFLNDLLKQENVRPDEIKAMGLDTFLKDKKNVTAAEVQDFIAQNKMGLGEAVYGGKQKGNFLEFLKDKGYPDDEALDILNKAQFGNLEGQVAALRDEYLNIRFEPTKFNRYSLPGGENYREVVITTPIENQDALHAAQAKAGDLRRQTGDLMQKYKDISVMSNPGDPDLVAAYQKVVESRKLMNQAEAEADKLRTVASQKTYRSSHWDEPNVLAHLRMSDRVTDGKKTLLVDEVQSDWHQAGREHGYANPEERQKIVDKLAREEPLTDEEEAARLRYLGGKNVPNAPYKEDWYQLALRRAVKEAIDGGYDRVALPTGQRVADRFKLTNQVDEIVYGKNGDIYFYKNGDSVHSLSGKKPEELGAIVGKEVAQKLLNSEPNKYGARTLGGVDLEVGGEGMKKYYDEIYPGYLKKFGKKYGASVGTTYAKTDIAEWPFPIKIESDGKNFWLHGQDPRIDKEAKLSGNFNSYEDANKFRDSMYEGNTEPLHYMDITPAMREAFKTGIHMKKGGKVSFASNVDAMRRELTKAK